jgi:hypothetical protein
MSLSIFSFLVRDGHKVDRAGLLVCRLLMLFNVVPIVLNICLSDTS